MKFEKSKKKKGEKSMRILKIKTKIRSAQHQIDSKGFSISKKLAQKMIKQ